MTKKNNLINNKNNMETITAKVKLVEYFDTSIYGNNRYIVILETKESETISVYTGVNSQYGYTIKNKNYKAFNEFTIETKKGKEVITNIKKL